MLENKNDKSYPKPAKYHTRWTKADNKRLKELVELNWTRDQIAVELGRNINAIRIKMTRLKMKKKLRQIDSSDGVYMHTGAKGEYNKSKKLLPNTKPLTSGNHIQDLQEQYIKELNEAGLNVKIIITNYAV